MIVPTVLEHLKDANQFDRCFGEEQDVDSNSTNDLRGGSIGYCRAPQGRFRDAQGSDRARADPNAQRYLS
jgi:hypothetical protein